MKVSLRQRSQSERDFFDKEAENNSEYWGWSTRTGKYRHWLRGELVKSHLKIGKGVKVLELGCGIGGLSQALSQTGGIIYVTDVSSKSVRLVKSKINSKNVRFRIEDAHRLSFAGNFFDAVCGNAILHHIELPVALPEIRRVLKSGGKICFIEPNLLNPEIFLERKIPILRKLSKSSPNEDAHSRWKLKGEFEKAGFVNLSVRPYDFIYPALPFFLAKPFKKLSDFLEKVPILKEFTGSLVITGERP